MNGSSGDVGEQDMDRLMALAADTVTLEEMKADQQPGEYAREVRKSLSGSRRAAQKRKWVLRESVLYARSEGVEELDALRVYVPESLRMRLVAIFHKGYFMMHAGRDATAAATTRRYYWKGMTKDIASYVRHCLMCRKAKAALPRRAGMLRQTFYGHCGSTLSIYLVGPFKALVQSLCSLRKACAKLFKALQSSKSPK